MALMLKVLQNIPNTPVGKVFNTIRMFNGYTPFPVSVLFYITYRCNLSCGFCFQTDERLKLVQQNPDMTMDELKDMVRQMKEFFPINPSIHLFGGEPMLHPKFRDFVEHLNKENVSSSVTTNGWMLEKNAKHLVDNNMRYINVSIDAREETHDKVRGLKGTYNAAIKGIKEVQKHKQEQGKTKPEVNVNTVINFSNHLDLEKIVEDLQHSGANFITLQHLIFTKAFSNEVEKMDTAQLKEQLKSIMDKDYDVPVMLFPGIKLDDLPTYYSSKDDIFSNKCLRPWFVPTILPNGNVTACPASGILGNIKQSPLKEIWNNTKYKAFRNAIENRGIGHSYCYRCCHRQYY